MADDVRESAPPASVRSLVDAPHNFCAPVLASATAIREHGTRYTPHAKGARMDAITTMKVHAEVLWASGYALFLLAVARALVAMRRRARAKDDTWPRTDAARFHHGLSMFLVLLAGLLVGACAVQHPEGVELGMLGLVSLTVAWMARRTWIEWWAEASSRGEG